jgi:hypothetical protein
MLKLELTLLLAACPSSTGEPFFFTVRRAPLSGNTVSTVCTSDTQPKHCTFDIEACTVPSGFTSFSSW